MCSIEMTGIRRNTVPRAIEVSHLSLQLEIGTARRRCRSVRSDSMSHHGGAQRAQQHRYSRISRPPQSLYLTLIILIVTFCSFTTAAASFPILQSEDSREDGGVDFRSALVEFAKSGIILVDPNPQPAAWNSKLELRPGIHEGDLHCRDADPIHLVERKASSSSTLATSTATSLVAATTLSTASALPSPFDSGLGTSFSSETCPKYINGFLETTQFKACLPFSMLLESSNTFFQAEKSIVRITQVLDVTCAVNVTECNEYMSTLANNLTAAGNCGADYENANSVVDQVYVGLLSYQTLYQASCLKNPSTGSYCFADAVTNSSSPTDSYVYYLPLNTSLPGGTSPTCGTCLQNTMAIFQATAANTTQPVSALYVPAAQEINIVCGSNFVNATIPVDALATSSSAALAPRSHKAVFMALAILVAGLLL